MARLGRNTNISEDDLRAHHQDLSQWALYCADFDHDLAREAVQQSYLKIVEGSARFGGNSTLKTWLFGVVRLTTQELKRKQYRDQARHAPEPEDLPVAEMAGEPLHAHPDKLALEKALGQLSLMQREIAYLVFYRDLPLSEIAEILGVSIGTVSKQYHRAKHRLAGLLGLGEEDRGNGSIVEKALS